MTPTVIVWLLLSIHSPERIDLRSQHTSREACSAEQVNKHFEAPRVEHRCVPIRVFVPVKKGPQQ